MQGGTKYKWKLNADGSADFPWMSAWTLYTNTIYINGSPYRPMEICYIDYTNDYTERQAMVLCSGIYGN
jgi:hypothetical protein